jgi:voltage-gated potassium channel
MSCKQADFRRPNLIERRMARFLREPVSVRNAASVIVVATLLLVVASGVAIRILDHRKGSNVWLGMWWALQTVTTVGYGDVTPKNTSGRIVGAVVIMEGIAFLAIITAAITSTFVARAQAQHDSARAAAEDLAEGDLRSQLEDLAGQGRVRHTLSGWRQLARIAYRDPEHVAERLTLYGA